MYIPFDIETVANEYAADFYRNRPYRARSNLKDPHKIASDLAAKRDKELSKAPLRWYTGKIICISLYYRDTPVVWSGNNERELLKFFFDYVCYVPNARIIGKSSRDFDIPYVIGRAMALNMGIPKFLRRNSAPLDDVDHIFSYRPLQCEQCSSLDDYAFGLDIEGKTNSGENIKKMHEQGQWEDIQNYCINDSYIVNEMVKRYEKRYEDE